MGKFAALLVLVSVAALSLLFKPETQVEVSEQVTPEASSPATSSGSAPQASEAQQLQTLAPAHDEHSDHQHEHGSDEEIPEFILKSLEAKRIPASELKEVHHPDGSVSMDLKGQYQHVPVAVLDEDGKVKIIEKVIEPIADEDRSK